MAYALNFLMVCFYGVFLKISKFTEKTKQICFLTLCSIQFTLLIGTRTLTTGTDTYGYYRIFQRITRLKNPFSVRMNNAEPVYRGLCWIVGKVGLSFMWLNLIVAAITMLFLSLAIYKLSSNIFFSMFLFISFCLLYQMQNQYRQIAALAIALYGISCLLEGKKLRFFLWISFAAGFHISVLVMIPLFILREVNITKRIVIFYVAVTIALTVGFNIVWHLLSFTYYAGYLGGMYDIREKSSVIMNFGVRMVLLLFSAFFYRKLIQTRKNILIFYHMAIICTILQFLAIQSALLGRITTYFFSGYLILIPEIMKAGFRKQSNKDILQGALFFIFTLWHYVYFNATLLGNGYIYNSFLFG